MSTFDHLCETFPDENCVLTSREILVEVTTHVSDMNTHTCWLCLINEEKICLVIIILWVEECFCD